MILAKMPQGDHGKITFHKPGDIKQANDLLYGHKYKFNEGSTYSLGRSQEMTP